MVVVWRKVADGREVGGFGLLCFGRIWRIVFVILCGSVEMRESDGKCMVN